MSLRWNNPEVALTFRNYFLEKDIVIPAKAGIHHLCSSFTQAGLILLGQVMDSRLRGNDEAFVFVFCMKIPLKVGT
jgi:hypothetical protein